MRINARHSLCAAHESTKLTFASSSSRPLDAEAMAMLYTKDESHVEMLLSAVGELTEERDNALGSSFLSQRLASTFPSALSHDFLSANIEAQGRVQQDLDQKVQDCQFKRLCSSFLFHIRIRQYVQC